MCLILRQRHRSKCLFSSEYLSRSCRSFQVFAWRFEFYFFKFVTCCWSNATVALTSSNWFLYFCIIFYNFYWNKTFIFSMSSLIIEDLNSFSFLSMIVLMPLLLTSLLSLWTAASIFLSAERLLGISIYT